MMLNIKDMIFNIKKKPAKMALAGFENIKNE